MTKVETSNWDTEFRLYEACRTSVSQSSHWRPSLLIDSLSKEVLSLLLEPFIHETHIEDISRETVSQKSVDTALSDQSKDGWIAYIGEEFYSVPEVESIYVTIEESYIDIWLVIPDRDIKLLRRIAEREIGVMERLAAIELPLFFLEFHVVYRHGADETQFVPDRAIRLLK